MKKLSFETTELLKAENIEVNLSYYDVMDLVDKIDKDLFATCLENSNYIKNSTFVKIEEYKKFGKIGFFINSINVNDILNILEENLKNLDCEDITEAKPKKQIKNLIAINKLLKIEELEEEEENSYIIFKNITDKELKEKYFLNDMLKDLNIEFERIFEEGLKTNKMQLKDINYYDFDNMQTLQFELVQENKISGKKWVFDDENGNTLLFSNLELIELVKKYLDIEKYINISKKNMIKDLSALLNKEYDEEKFCLFFYDDVICAIDTEIEVIVSNVDNIKKDGYLIKQVYLNKEDSEIALIYIKVEETEEEKIYTIKEIQ